MQRKKENDFAKPLISVVVPLWNVEADMRACVDSILLQSYSRLEVVLVDDGSPDDCGSIADTYAKRDSRVRVIHQSNGGLSAARNAGTLAAKGDYITYVDGDDYLEPGCIEYLWELMRNANAQLSICQNWKKCTLKHHQRRNLQESLTPEEAMEAMLYQKKFDTSACGKLYRIDDARAIPFPEGKLYEDLATVYKRIWQAQQIALGSRGLYHYRVRPGSITRRQFHPQRFDEIEAIEQLERFVKRNCPALARAALCRKFSCFCQVYLAMPDDDEVYKDEGQRLWHFIANARWAVMTDRRARFKNRCAACLALLGSSPFRAVWAAIAK